MKMRQRYDFMVLEWIDVPGKGQPVLGTFTHYLKDHERAGLMADKIADKFDVVVAVITIHNGKAISIGLPVEVAA
jgi:hypothetical protein